MVDARSGSDVWSACLRYVTPLQAMSARAAPSIPSASLSSRACEGSHAPEQGCMRSLDSARKLAPFGMTPGACCPQCVLYELLRVSAVQPHVLFAPVLLVDRAGRLQALVQQVVERLDPHVPPPGGVVHEGLALDVRLLALLHIVGRASVGQALLDLGLVRADVGGRAF